FLLFLPQLAFGWGSTGHRIGAGIAMQQLQQRNPAVADKVRALLGGESLVAVSTLPDAVRPQRPLTGPWHFANIPLAAPQFELQRDCPHPTCTPGTPDCIAVSCMAST